MVTKKDFADSTGAGEMAAMLDVKVSGAMIKYLKDKRDMWSEFGKMTSHLYRGQLFEAMSKAQLTSEAKFMVFALASVIKSQPRVVQAMKDTKAEDQFLDETTWFSIRNFFETNCTQYVTVSKKEKKFPMVNIPSAMPGFDILAWCLTTGDGERNWENLIRRPTFTQIALKEEAQTEAKRGYEFYWTKIIKGTKNKDEVEKPGMNESYYQTAAADKYSLLTLDERGKMAVIEPSSTTRLYSKAEVETYLRSFDDGGAIYNLVNTRGSGTGGPSASR